MRFAFRPGHPVKGAGPYSTSLVQQVPLQIQFHPLRQFWSSAHVYVLEKPNSNAKFIAGQTVRPAIGKAAGCLDDVVGRVPGVDGAARAKGGHAADRIVVMMARSRGQCQGAHREKLIIAGFGADGDPRVVRIRIERQEPDDPRQIHPLEVEREDTVSQQRAVPEVGERRMPSVPAALTLLKSPERRCRMRPQRRGDVLRAQVHPDDVVARRETAKECLVEAKPTHSLTHGVGEVCRTLQVGCFTWQRYRNDERTVGPHGALANYWKIRVRLRRRPKLTQVGDHRVDFRIGQLHVRHLYILVLFQHRVRDGVGAEHRIRVLQP